MVVFETADLAAASYSVALFGLVATTILLLFGTGWVSRTWKIVIVLCSLACLVGIGAMFEARMAWGSAKSVPVVYHYVGWAVSIPLQVMALYFYANRVERQTTGLFWRLVVVSILMIFVRYLGEAGFMHATLAFLIGLIFWLYILGELYFGRMDDSIRKSGTDPVRRGYFWLRLIVTVGWAIYPLGNFITSFGGYSDDGSLSVTYNLFDFLNRMVFGVAILAVGLIDTTLRKYPEDSNEQR
jgi:sensory rhodopsin